MIKFLNKLLCYVPGDIIGLIVILLGIAGFVILDKF